MLVNIEFGLTSVFYYMRDEPQVIDGFLKHCEQPISMTSNEILLRLCPSLLRYSA